MTKVEFLTVSGASWENAVYSAAHLFFSQIPQLQFLLMLESEKSVFIPACRSPAAKAIGDGTQAA
jgi:hypothetical protein